MHAIYVRLGDNDFSNTVKAFMKVLAPRVLLGYWDNITKQQVVDLFNEHAYTFYCLNQSKDIEIPLEKKEMLKKYLQIKTKDVYFDLEEIKKHTNLNNDGCLASIGDQYIIYQIM